MPFLFEQWGPILSAVAGVAFFGLLFFAGITSSLAMGTPGMGFMMDEYKWSRKKAAVSFGVVVMILGLPTIFFFSQGVFDEYDYWAGTVSLVVFALLESILFSWVFGLKKGWKEITDGADIKVPLIYRFIIKYITPVALILVFTGALIRPVGDDWSRLSIKGWKLHNESILGQLQHKGAGPNRQWFSRSFYAEAPGIVDSIYATSNNKFYFRTSAIDKSGNLNSKVYKYTPSKQQLLVEKGDLVETGQVIYAGPVVNRVFYLDMARLLLLSVFLLISLLVYFAWRKRTKERRI
jgi:hypothetical protein